ncbi:RNA signal recognition particle [Candidatus Kaiserbacteria bacterium RIFCSPHIGHO2_01_FULL_55_17]|uniref:RNA signal recognition particle n=1 Tax=Candidatus Kaiserbacteria bacterium RIFCSPHIGHO2_01_FULL_55_17 TaxID=1798484 RepID=A0A1F6D829_9BACT|nr:MAG: RNA signal recognition particle [Candidatus Kaiserbacteria bacterium RIFCSPHIGHO2_01_FULL_55_17]
MAKYVDGFVIVAPKAKRAEYRTMATWGKKMWMKYGALDYKECVGDDMQPGMQGMSMRTFPKLAGARKGEDVWFSFIVYKSKKHRDAVNKKVMKGMEKEMAKYKDKPMPFDMKRFSVGGFKVVVDR